jgi:hypothetical protein
MRDLQRMTCDVWVICDAHSTTIKLMFVQNVSNAHSNHNVTITTAYLKLLLNLSSFSRNKNAPETHKYFVVAFAPRPFNVP